MASPSRRRRRRRRRRQRRRTRTVPLGVFLYHTTLPAARDWAELPVDAILQVFRWLDHVDVLMGAGLACRSWRAAARDEPVLWRRIDMRGFACLPYWQRHRRDTVRAMAREAVRRSDGRCEEFWSKVGGDDEVLRFLADHAPYLRSIRLVKCDHVSKEGISAIIQSCPLLEALYIDSDCILRRDIDALRDTNKLRETNRALSIQIRSHGEEEEADRAQYGKDEEADTDYGDDEFTGDLSPWSSLCFEQDRDDGLDEFLESEYFLEPHRYLHDVHLNEFDEEQDCRMLDKGDRRYLKAEGWTYVE
uniref:F-box domain-containing protein n=1 Tax=Oryza glumipatula TaxID=40148 RepID=A0A0E0ARW2_9ORYZ